MRRRSFVLLPLLLAVPAAARAETAQRLPDPALDTPSQAATETAILAGGCFWGVQAVFQHVKGVSTAISGYSGGAKETAEYETVGTGRTGHAEAVQIVFDPRKISFGQILRIFFSVALDPTQLDRQGPDWGTQYRSEIFTASPEQDRVARAYIAQLDAAKSFPKPIVTRINPLKAFYPAEDYHQDYLQLHPDNGYIVINDQPKVANLKRLFPEAWNEKPTRVFPPRA